MSQKLHAPFTQHKLNEGTSECSQVCCSGGGIHHAVRELLKEFMVKSVIHHTHTYTHFLSCTEKHAGHCISDYEFAESRRLGAKDGWTFGNGSSVSPEKQAWEVWACLPLDPEGHVSLSHCLQDSTSKLRNTEAKSPEEKRCCKG